MKAFFKNKGTWIWTIVTAVVVAVFIVLNVVAVHFSNIISIAMGGDRPYEVDAEDAVTYYETTTKSKDEANELAAAVTREISEEGTILLKNEGNALPLKQGAEISVFGKNSVNLVYGGSGSGGGDQTFAKKTIFDSLTEAGFTFNPELKAFYEDNSRSGSPRSGNPSDLDSGNTVSIATGETPQSKYTSKETASYADYKDAALIVISRVGGEGFDLPMGAANGAKHYLDLDTNEKELLAHVKSQGFGKVIVVLNTLNIVETGFLQTYGIDACLWIGGPGSTGIMALGDILNGKVTPSGHTTDTWPFDFTKDPVWNNFSDRNMKNGDAYFNTDTGKDVLNYYVNYEESVYVGYRYYETRAEQERAANGGSDEWYTQNVAYPFGYGMSYTSFEWNIKDDSKIKNVGISADGDYEVTVTVTNTGSFKGKDVVQLYAELPYENGGVEKPYEVLCGFAKTPMLYPASEANGADKPNSCDMTLKFTPYDIASYDYKGVSGFKGYIIESGNYELLISKDAHTPIATVPFRVDNDITYSVDPVSGNDVKNLYTDCTDSTFNSDTRLDFLMSRKDLSVLPDEAKQEDRNITSALLVAINDTSHNNPNADSYEMPKQGASPTPLANVITYDNQTQTYVADYNNQAWEAVLNSLSVKDMADLFNNGAFKTDHIERINKPQTLDSDGPVGWCNFIAQDDTWKGNNAYTSQVVMSATWNTELIEKMGECVGEEGLWGAKRTAADEGLAYSGWYSPGVNIHRSQFGGRNFEYFSEDPFLTGKIGAAEVTGCQSKGVYCYVKHFALNEQETHRGGGSSWVTEQAMREIYLKPFEIVVKDGKTRAMMSSFNRIGTRWTGGDYRLLTQILREEWGFKGMVISDYNENSSYMDAKQMIYAGGDLNLCSNKAKMWSTYDGKSASDVTVLRMATKNILYTTANSNMINSFNYKYAMAIWKILLIVLDCAVAAGLAVWGVFVTLKFIKKTKN